MTEPEVTAPGPAFAAYLRRFRRCFRQGRTAAHFDTYCRGLLSDLPRESVEPIALEAGTAVRTPPEFRATAEWDHATARDVLQHRLGAVAAARPADDLGTVGVIDETSCRKWGDQTPGARRPYLGCVGEVEHGIVTAHIAVTRGTFPALAAADLYPPRGRDADRDRCREAGTPDDARRRPEWRIAPDELARVGRSGVRPDGLVSDEGCGAAAPVLRTLDPAGRPFVAEVPVNFAVRGAADGPPRRADARLTAAVWAAGRWHTLIAAINEAAAGVKYFPTDATADPAARVPAVAFRRATAGHAFRPANRAAGRMHYEGRDAPG